LSCFEDLLNAEHDAGKTWPRLSGVRYGIRLPKIMIDGCLLMIIVAGMGLTVAYLRAEYVLHRGFKADEQEKLSLRHELAANRLKPRQMDAPVAALRIHQRCLGKRSRFARRADRDRPVYSRTSTDIGIARRRNPTGDSIFVANSGSNTLSGFFCCSQQKVVAMTGSPYATGTHPSAVTVDTLDKFVYVANQGSNNISAFALDATTGALTVVAGSPFAAGTEPSSVAVDPTDMFTYVVNSGADTIFVYSIDATTGALTPIGGSPFATATQPTAIAISD